MEEGVWKWVTGEPFSFTRWYYVAPNNWAGEEHYLGYRSDGEWNDLPGTFYQAYLLEYEQSINPLNPDTDGDGLTDGDEVLIHGSSFRPTPMATACPMPTKWLPD